MRYQVVTPDGQTSEIDAVNLLVGFGMALEQQGKDVSALDEAVFSFRNGGARVWIADTRPWWIRPYSQADSVVVAVPPSRGAASQEPVEVIEEPADQAEPDDLTEEVEDPQALLAERLFDLSGELASRPDEVAEVALNLVMEFIDVESGSVVRGTINDPHLTYVAARGPVASEIVGRSVPFGEGLVGMCFDRGSVVRVSDARQSTYHRTDVDRTTGYGTRAVLCAPIMDDDGHRYGVIQLLNPRAGTFGDRDMAVIDNVSRSVGALLAEMIDLD